MRRHCGRRFILESTAVQRLIDHRLGHNHLCGQIVGATRPKHKGIHAHADVLTLRLNALPHEHASTRIRIAHTRLRADLEVGTASGHRHAYPKEQ